MDLIIDFLKNISAGLGESIGYEIGDFLKLLILVSFRKSETEKKENS